MVFRGRRRDASEPRRGTPADWLVVGLGNPGPEYESTRHNVGANAVLEVAAHHGGTLKKSKELALTDEVTIAGQRVALAFPQTYMNESGRSVQLLVRRYGVAGDPTRWLIVHDELDLDPGRLKLKIGGGLAGHNGLRSITQHTRTQDYLRLRMGVGKPPNPRAGAGHVLKRPPKKVLEVLDDMIVRGADAIEAVITEGPEAAMTAINAR